MKAQFHPEVLERSDVLNFPEITAALSALLEYLSRTQITGLERMEEIRIYSQAKTMRLDLNTRRNLELLETMRSKERRGSLLWVLDKTKTAMGKRLIRTWLEQPLFEPGGHYAAAKTRWRSCLRTARFLDDVTGGADGHF